jgi:hypothetical protein
MSEMVDRVAEALWVANSKDRFGKWGGLEGQWKDKWRADARAAIEAMREPTYDMRFGDDVKEWPEDAAACWKAMIDAALASEEGK